MTSYVVPGVLVGWNTYVSRMWFGFLLPLLLLAPFAVSLVLPVTRARGRRLLQDVEDPQSPEEELSKGEVLLLENKEETRYFISDMKGRNERYFMF